MSLEVVVGIVGFVVFSLVFLGGLIWVQSSDVDEDAKAN